MKNAENSVSFTNQTLKQSAKPATTSGKVYIFLFSLILKMAQKKEVYKEKIKQVGYWNYKGVYDMLFSWLKDQGYKVFEDTYDEKLAGNGKEI